MLLFICAHAESHNQTAFLLKDCIIKYENIFMNLISKRSGLLKRNQYETASDQVIITDSIIARISLFFHAYNLYVTFKINLLQDYS